MNLIVADDASQRHPSRRGCGPLVATGGLVIPSVAIHLLERQINEVCRKFGFPRGEEFKWSPSRTHWMHDNLVGDVRQNFFGEILGLAREYQAKALVVVEDKNFGSATGADHEMDSTFLFLERAHNYLKLTDTEGVLLADWPSGDRRDEDRFIGRCLDTIAQGTDFVTPDRISFVVSAPSDRVRLLQLADVVASCTLARVAGESQYSPSIFDELIRPILLEAQGRSGGLGLKIHPDTKYLNLYHWLLGDDYYMRGATGYVLPHSRFLYAGDADTP